MISLSVVFAEWRVRVRCAKKAVFLFRLIRPPAKEDVILDSDQFGHCFSNRIQ